MDTTDVCTQLRRPSTRSELSDCVKELCGLTVPDVRICSGHSSVMDYLWHGFSADFTKGVTNGDAVVWACRGGSKTMMGAVLSFLDCVFKPGCDVRILGGSLEQSQRMYTYLTGFLDGENEQLLNGPARSQRCRFINGSRVEVLSQSQRSVRGSHVHKLRCDELELFDRDVFEAAKYITKSGDGHKAGMEMLSTMHRPWGLMNDTVIWANENHVPVFSWCMWEVIEQCRDRECSRCPLWEYCRGRARQGGGFLSVDDCITQLRRSSRSGFESEMLCLRPSLDRAVFGDFSEEVHVGELHLDPTLPLYLAVDFGFVNPFVCLFIQPDNDGGFRVVKEYSHVKRLVHEHVDNIMARAQRRKQDIASVFCDPAGAARNDVTGTSPIRVMREMGLRVRYRRSMIGEGIELIRRALRAGDGKKRLVIDRRCKGLIRAMASYHFPEQVGDREIPLKDGVNDHYIDALRYFFVNYAAASWELEQSIY